MLIIMATKVTLFPKLSQTNLVQPSPPIHLTSILILYTHLRLYLPSCLLFSYDKVAIILILMLSKYLGIPNTSLCVCVCGGGGVQELQILSGHVLIL